MTSKTPDVLIPLIFDNTVLSNFALVQAFDLLQRLYAGRAFVCSAVFAEVRAGVESGWKYPWLHSRTRLQAVDRALESGWLRLADSETEPSDEVVEPRLTYEYSKRFGACESESMAIAYCRGWIFASDCRRARDFAKERSIKVTGSIGILVKAVTEEAIALDVADALHARMIDEEYRSPLPYEQGISTYLKRNKL